MAADFKETWRLFAAGSHDALNDIYKQHYLGLINYGIKLTDDRPYANDCIVEMLLGLWEKRDKLPEVENVRSYLLTCLRTVIFQKIRSEKIGEVKETYAQSLSEKNDLPYEDYITKLQSDSIIKARLSKSLNKLTDRQKELLAYRFFEDLDYDEIALKCGISKRTAYNIVYDALKILKEDLKKEGKDGFYHLLSLINLGILSATLHF
jgi:RNA polymerase sigma factor (sigma-70 family)